MTAEVHLHIEGAAVVCRMQGEIALLGMFNAPDLLAGGGFIGGEEHAGAFLVCVTLRDHHGDALRIERISPERIALFLRCLPDDFPGEQIHRIELGLRGEVAGVVVDEQNGGAFDLTHVEGRGFLELLALPHDLTRIRVQAVNGLVRADEHRADTRDVLPFDVLREFGRPIWRGRM